MVRFLERAVKTTVSLCLGVRVACTFLAVGFLVEISEASDLNVSLAKIQNRAEIGNDGHPTGVYVELFKRMDEAYQDGAFTIGVFPFARSVNNLQAGIADIHFPIIRSQRSEALPFIWVEEVILTPSFVLYSHKDRPLNPGDDLTGKKIESISGASSRSFNFKIGIAESPSAGLTKLSLGRIDGYIGEQGISDLALREKGFDNIHRALFSVVDMGMAVPNSAEGRALADKMARVIRSMKDDPETRAFMDTVYPPYDDWQTYW